MKTTLILFIIALTIRLSAILYWRFDGLYGQDAYAYLQQGLAIAHSLSLGQLPPDHFFWPNGYPALIALSTQFLGQTALAAQLVSLLCGACLSPLAYLLSRDLWLDELGQVVSEPSVASLAGLLAGLIVAVAGQPILSSIVIMADIPALFWAMVAAWGLIRATRPLPEPLKPETATTAAVWFFIAGAAFALALTSRWIYGLIGPALAGYTIYRNYRYQRAWWPLLFAILSGLLILLPQLWLSARAPDGLVHSFLLGWQLPNFFRRQFINADGYFSYRLPNAIFYAQPAGHPAYIFPVLGAAVVWSGWRLWRLKGWAPLILLLGWIGPVYLFLGGIPFQNFRFNLTHYLPLIILTGYGLSDLLSLISSLPAENRLAPGSVAWSPLLKTIIALSLIGMLAWAYPMLDTFLTTQNHNKTIAYEIEKTLPAEATLVAFGLTLTLQHYTRLNTVDLYYFDETSLDNLTKTEPSFYLLLDPPNIETQWQGKPLQQNFHWLKEKTKLIKIGSYPPYVLFKVE